MLLDYIALLTYRYYKKNQKDEKELERLNKNLEEVQGRIEKLFDSVEEGVPFSKLKKRYNALTEEETELQDKITEIELKPAIKLTEDHIRFFLYKMRERDYTDANCQKQLIDTFVNKIVLYEDKAVIALNYSGDFNEITVTDIQKADDSQGVRLLNVEQACVDEKRTVKVYKNVFIIEMPISNERKN